MSRLLLGPTLLALLLGIGLYGAVCVNVKPTVQPTPVVTLVIVQPASPSPTVYQFPTMTPVPERLPVLVATPTTPPAVVILDTPEPTATPVPMLVVPTPTNTRVATQKG